MISSLPINNGPVLWHNTGVSHALVSTPGKDVQRYHPPERAPQVPDLEETALMEERLARRAQQNLKYDGLEVQNRKAINAYQSLVSGEERDVVSEILGINVYA